MATVISKTVDTSQGAVFLRVKDAIFGNETNHTIYVALVPDVNAKIAQICSDADQNATAIHANLSASGLI